MVNGQGEDEDEDEEIMSMDCPMVIVKWVGRAWVKWRLARRPGHGGEAKSVGVVVGFVINKIIITLFH